MSDTSDPRNPWHEFCDALKGAGDVVFRDATPGDELTRAEGLRHLVRMIRAGFEVDLRVRGPRATPS